VIEDRFARFALRRNFGQPDGGFNRLELAEERAKATEFMEASVEEKPDRFRRGLPIRRIRQRTPGLQALPHFINYWSRIVLLLFGRKALSLIKDGIPLARPLLLPRFRDRRDELRFSPAFDNSLSRLPLVVQLPVP
jgi:hypothetical protein